MRCRLSGLEILQLTHCLYCLSHRNRYDGAELGLLHPLQSPSPPPHRLGSPLSRVAVRPVISAHLWTLCFERLDTEAVLCLGLRFGSVGEGCSAAGIGRVGEEGGTRGFSFQFFLITRTKRVFFNEKSGWVERVGPCLGVYRCQQNHALWGPSHLWLTRVIRVLQTVAGETQTSGVKYSWKQ